jgi:hypothetical protein
MPTACHEFHEFTRKPARTIGEIRVIRGKKPVALSPPQLVHAPVSANCQQMQKR